MAEDRQPPTTPDATPFGPPSPPILVECIHCGEAYESFLIEWRLQRACVGNGEEGFWCCPTSGCDGVGFLFDIWPVDPDWTDENGEKVVFFTDDDDEDTQFEFPDLPPSPADSGDQLGGTKPATDDDMPF